MERFCIDFRKLNQVTTMDVYPIPRIDDCLDALGGNTLFSTFDMHAGYWQIPMKDQDKAKTAFITDSGFFEFNILPFGLERNRYFPTIYGQGASRFEMDFIISVPR
jgi:hypothetical protein